MAIYNFNDNKKEMNELKLNLNKINDQLKLLIQNNDSNKADNFIFSSLEWFRKHWGIIVSFVVAISIIALFIASFVTTQKIEIDIMNNWVGIILGFVATFMSIISMYLSFYNLEKSNEINKDNMILMIGLKDNMFKNYELMEQSKEIFNHNKEYIKELGMAVEELVKYQSNIISHLDNIETGIASALEVRDLSNAQYEEIADE